MEHASLKHGSAETAHFAAVHSASEHTLAGIFEMQGVLMKVERNVEIYGEAEPAEYLYQVVKGAVRTYKVLQDGRRQIGAFHLPGDVFGLEADEEYSFSAEAVCDCTLRLARRATIVAMAARDSDLATDLWQRTAEAFRRAQDQGRLRLLDVGIALDPNLLWFNLGDPSPKRDLYRNRTFRQAISYAIDRTAIVNTVYLGAAVPIYGPVTEGNRHWYSTSAPTYPYDPARAEERLHDHARHFAWLVNELLNEYQQETGQFGVISAAYDTELFGHWWFEGVLWLREVLRNLAQNPNVELTTATRIIEDHAPERVLDLPETSWGAGGDHSTWLNRDTESMWPVIHERERTMEQLVASVDAGDEQRTAILAQAARELVLLESSDWPFLVTTGQAKEYAIERFTEHVKRFDQLAELATQETAYTNDQIAFLSGLRDRDNPFPDIDIYSFAARQGHAEKREE